MSNNAKTTPSIFILIRGFWAHLSIRRKRELAGLLIIMMLASFAELLSLGAVLPFLGVLTTPEKVFGYPGLQSFLQVAGIQDPQELLMPVTIAFILAASLAGGMRLLLLYVNTKLSFSIGADFSYEIYRRTLYQPYLVHVSRNSSQIISGITGKTAAVIQGLLTPVLTLLSSIMIFIAIFIALLVLDPIISAIAFIGFGAIYGSIIMLTRKRMEMNSHRLAQSRTQVIKFLQEGLGGIRDILIDGSQAVYCDNYRRADIPLRDAQASSLFIGGAPRYAVETLGMILIAALAYVMAQQPGGLAKTVTILGALALGAQRLLPVLQQVYSSVVAMRAGAASVSDALDLINQPMDSALAHHSSEPLTFTRDINLRDLSFRYTTDGPWVLKDINLRIPRGERIGFIGTTGSGKSTLLDIVMGLLPATEGEVLIDDVPLQPYNQRAWQRRIAHVPQTIYLSDASIAENIAFGLPPEKIDHGRVRRAAQQAQVAAYIDSLADGYSTRVGERGVRLSGGQRQRIGIARALYNDAEVIILDEATSALDSQTELDVMKVIDELSTSLTVMIIAHRLSTLKRCNVIVELSRGSIGKIGSYSDVVNSENI